MQNIMSWIIPRCNLIELQIYVRRCHFKQRPLLGIFFRYKTGHRNVVENLVSNLENSKERMFSSVAVSEKVVGKSYDNVALSREQQDQLKKKGMATWYFKNYVTAMQLYNNNQSAKSLNKEKIKHFLKPEIHYESNTKTNIWSACMTVFHPEEKVFSSSGPKKKDVENQLAFEAVHWLWQRSMFICG